MSDQEGTKFSVVKEGGITDRLEGLKKAPDLTLNLAIRYAQDQTHGDKEFAEQDFDFHVEMAKEFAQQKLAVANPLALTEDELAAVHLYTQESEFHKIINARLRSEERIRLKSFFPIIKLLLRAFYKFPVYQGKCWRGIKGEIASKFTSGSELVWWGFTNTTTNLEVMMHGTFFGYTGKRTYFSIDVKAGVSLGEYSAFPDEEEVILLPGTNIRVIITNSNLQNTIIQLFHLYQPGER